MLTRTTLRAPRDNRPLTQGTEIRYSAAQDPNNTQGAEVKRRMAGSLGNRTSTRVEGFDVATVSASASARPESYTAEVIDVGPSESESTFVGSLGLGGDSGGPAPAAAKPSTSSGRKSGRRKMPKSKKDKLPTTNQLVKRDIKRYGNTVPKGSFGSGSRKTIKASPGSRVDTNVGRHKPGTSKDQPKTKLFQKSKFRQKGGQGGLALGTTTRRQGEKPTGPAVSLSNYKDNRAKQRRIRAQSRLSSSVKATGIPTRPKAGSFGISKEGRKQAEANKKEARRKKEAKAREKAKAKLKSKAAAAAAKAKSEGKSKAQQAAAARKAAGPNRKMSFGQKTRAQAGPSARTAAGNRARVRSNARKRAQAAAKKRRANRRCDIRCKFDISILTNQNLMRDDLADVAYFVRTLKEINE